MPVCNVCNKNQTQRVCNSQLAPMSNAYCDPCFEMGLEPWGDFVGAIFSSGITTKSQIKTRFSENFLNGMIKFHERTIDEALKEAKQTQDSFNEYWTSRQGENNDK